MSVECKPWAEMLAFRIPLASPEHGRQVGSVVCWN